MQWNPLTCSRHWPPENCSETCNQANAIRHLSYFECLVFLVINTLKFQYLAADLINSRKSNNHHVNNHFEYLFKFHMSNIHGHAYRVRKQHSTMTFRNISSHSELLKHGTNHLHQLILVKTLHHLKLHCFLKLTNTTPDTHSHTHAYMYIIIHTVFTYLTLLYNSMPDFSI